METSSRVTQPKAERLIKNSANEKKQNENDNIKVTKTSMEEITKTKIYLPKAARVSPESLAISNKGFDNMGISGSSSSPSDGEENMITSNGANPVAWWPDLLEEEAC